MAAEAGMTTRAEMLRSGRLAGGVKRYHAWPTIQVQTVADHSWNVGRIWLELFDSLSLVTAKVGEYIEIGQKQTVSDVMVYILYHDITEMSTGDIPFPVKRDNVLLKQAVGAIEIGALERMGLSLPVLDDYTKGTVKLADLLEMWEFGCMELALGNKLAGPIIADTSWAAFQLAENELDCAGRVSKWMEEQKRWLP